MNEFEARGNPVCSKECPPLDTRIVYLYEMLHVNIPECFLIQMNVGVHPILQEQFYKNEAKIWQKIKNKLRTIEARLQAQMQ